MNERKARDERTADMERQRIDIRNIPDWSWKKPAASAATANAEDHAYTNTVVQEKVNEAVSMKQEMREVKIERDEMKFEKERKGEEKAVEMAQEASGRANIRREARMIGMTEREAKAMSRSVNSMDAREQGNFKVRKKEKTAPTKISTKKLVSELRRGRSLNAVKREQEAGQKEMKKKINVATKSLGKKRALTSKQLDALRRGKSLSEQRAAQTPQKRVIKKTANREMLNRRLKEKANGR